MKIFQCKFIILKPILPKFLLNDQLYIVLKRKPLTTYKYLLFCRIFSRNLGIISSSSSDANPKIETPTLAPNNVKMSSDDVIKNFLALSAAKKSIDA